MKKIISTIGIASILCLMSFCKKDNTVPAESEQVTQNQEQQQPEAELVVQIDSKPCEVPQPEFTSATLDIRGIRVFNTVHGWEELIPISGAWDLVSLQQAPVPVAEITEVSPVHSGTITLIELTYGDNNHLVVNNSAVRCYTIHTLKETHEIEEVIPSGTHNVLVLSIDICGNIIVQNKYDQEPCYTLLNSTAFQSFISTPLAK